MAHTLQPQSLTVVVPRLYFALNPGGMRNRQPPPRPDPKVSSHGRRRLRGAQVMIRPWSFSIS